MDLIFVHVFFAVSATLNTLFTVWINRSIIDEIFKSFFNMSRINKFTSLSPIKPGSSVILLKVQFNICIGTENICLSDISLI